MIATSQIRTCFVALAVLAPLLPAAALAATATASQNTSVRLGPDATSGVVAEIARGDAVDISKCQGAFCYITFPHGKGWISANYLTRDTIPGKPVAASAAPRIATTNFPPAYRAGTSPKAKETTLPPVANTVPRAPIQQPPLTTVGRAGYDESQAGNDHSYALDSDSGAASPAPGDDLITRPNGTTLPRPKVDIPDAPLPDQAMAGDDTPGVPDAYGRGDAALPDWNDPRPAMRGDFGRSDRFAEIDRPGRDRVCFFTDGGDGGRFCMVAGQSMNEFGNWHDRIAAIRNPRGLRVTICSTGDGRDCRVYEQSGPVQLPDDAGIASISVAPPAGY